MSYAVYPKKNKYQLEDECPVPWNAHTESQLHHDYPLSELESSSVENFVIRRYLETLWLPECLNPLAHLVISLQRLQPVDSDLSIASDITLHELLDPLLLSSRDASEKYRTELVHILADGGGAGEQEECMMWYAWNYEKDGDGDAANEVESEKWKKRWLERLERRETMIQILLNMLKLSWRGEPKGSRKDSSSRLKHKKKKYAQREPMPETDEERLESFMDKLSMWNLTASLSEENDLALATTKGKEKADRHWTHIFLEDVVEPLFKTSLPTHCALLRSKLFPRSPFSDVDESDQEFLNKESAHINPHASSSLLKTSSTNQSSSARPGMHMPSMPEHNAHAALNRSRSRSLSVSLLQDEEKQRRSVIEPRKDATRVLSREISMSRVFKNKSKPDQRTQAPCQSHRNEASTTNERPKAKTGVMLVAETPFNRQRTKSCADSGLSQPTFTTSPLSHLPLHKPQVLVEDTPIKFRPDKSDTIYTRADRSPFPISPLTPLSQQSKKEEEMIEIISDEWAEENTDDSFTGSFGSPDILLLRGEGLMAPPSHAPATRSPTETVHNSALRLSAAMSSALESPTKKRKTRA